MSLTVPLDGFGGGGNPLNFKVVGNPQPENPKGNTIWVNTDVPITGWIFSATEPEAPAEGMVWISTGTASNAEFNALKKNGIQVYPISAKQYVSGAFVSKDAMIYKNGEWIELLARTYLYKEGDECIGITGGWVEVSGFADANELIKTATNLTINALDASALTIAPDTLGSTFFSDSSEICVETGEVSTSVAFVSLNSKKDRSGTELNRASLLANTVNRLPVSTIASGYLVIVANKGIVKIKNIWLE